MSTSAIINCIDAHIESLYKASRRVNEREFYDLMYIINRLTDLAYELEKVAYADYLATISD